MRKGFDARLFPAEVGFERMFHTLAEAGFEGVELGFDLPGATAHTLSFGMHGADFSRVRRLSVGCDLHIAAITCPSLGRTPIGSADKATRCAARETLRRLVEAACELDAEAIVMEPTGDADAPLESVYPRVMETLQWLFLDPDARTFSLLFENGPYVFFPTPAAAASFFREFPLPMLGLCLNGDTVPLSQRLLEALPLLRRLIRYVRVGSLKSPRMPELLGTSAVWEQLSGRLNAMAYSGVYTARCILRTPGEAISASHALDRMEEPEVPVMHTPTAADFAPGDEPESLLNLFPW